MPKEDHFYDFVEDLARLSNDAAVALQRFQSSSAVEVRDAVQKIEHAADDIVRKMEDALSRTFVTPLDREDLHHLASQLDDIVDVSNLTARAYHLYHIDKPTPAMLQLMEKLVTVTGMIKDCVPMLRRHDFPALLDGVRKVRLLEKEADTIYRSAISDLFAGPPVDARELLKQKEALDDLERAVDHCDKVADLLSNLSLKHG